MRRLCDFPPQGVLAEVTTLTFQRRPLLAPRPELTPIVVGFLARAQRMTGQPVCAFTFLPDHYHLLLRVAGARPLARFMAYFNAGVAREVNRLTGWGSFVWAPPGYRAKVVAEDEAAQVERLRAVLGHPCRLGWPGRCLDWPGPQSVRALLEDSPLAGHWVSRSRESAARRRGEAVHPLEFALPETLRLAPLPCWERLKPRQRRRRVGDLVAGIEAASALAREIRGPAGGTATSCWAFARRDRRELWIA